MGESVAALRLRNRESAEGYVASICFKHGPPRLYGVELEWTVHHADDPARPVDAPTLCHALGRHTPATLAPTASPAPLPHGSSVSVEPGGQVELSTAPRDSIDSLLDATARDIEHLDRLLTEAALVRGDLAVDCHRPPTRLLQTPRYASMQTAFDRIGPDGVQMMCSTAAVQVCVDAGEEDRVAARWAAVNGLGPVFIALFANSAAVARDGAAWECSRMRAVLGTDPARSSPAGRVADPATAWARQALDTPLLCVRRTDNSWDAPPGVTFADWIDGALPEPPTVDDLEYHLSTLFPPVRPRGYLEVRYIDAQAGDAWTTPVTLLAALTADEQTVDAVVDITAPVADLWVESARQGLAHEAIASAAERVLDLGCDTLDVLGLPPATAEQIYADLAHKRAALSPSRR